jgi:hypothetical protein
MSRILSGEQVSTTEKVYKTSAPDFQLSVFELKAATLFLIHLLQQRSFC